MHLTTQPLSPPSPTYSQQAAFSTPVKDQVLVYTPELRGANVGEFLAQGNHALAALNRCTTLHTRMYPLAQALYQLSYSPSPKTHTHTQRHTHSDPDERQGWRLV